ncbi:MAG: hypothetical protein HY951_00995 [Bacteroidia bacterium]|nr:hypothetical protein [Bacteroidia bacterium]
MNKKGTVILEYVWLALTIFGAVTGSYKVVTTGFKESAVFFIIAAISAFMYMLRRAMRKFSDHNNTKK